MLATPALEENGCWGCYCSAALRGVALGQGQLGPNGGKLRNPDQVGVVRDSFVGDEVPVLLVAEPLRVAIEESEMGALVVQIGMNVVLLGHRGELAVVKQPDRRDRPEDAGDFRLIARAAAVDVFVEAIVEEVVAVAAAGTTITNTIPTMAQPLPPNLPNRQREAIDGSAFTRLLPCPRHTSLVLLDALPRRIHILTPRVQLRERLPGVIDGGSR